MSWSQLPHGDERYLRVKRGLLLQHLELPDAGTYTCASREHSYSQVLARYRLHVIPSTSLGPAAPLPGLRNPWLQQSYKDLHLVGSNSLSADEYCEQLWHREKRRQQKLRTLKLKHEGRKARVRRNNPPEAPL